MNITITFDIKRYKTALSKSYIDIHCTAHTQISDSLSSSSQPDSSYIFVIQKLPKNALGQNSARFSHIADPVDIQDFPIEQSQDIPYFRAKEITLRVRSQFQSDRIISIMRKEVKDLVQALSVMPDSQESFSETFAG